ncbi:isoaspartyl peptidase/L-asparaginase family protein [Prosthecobacter sp.]|uniref:isoaspartyl peptidase/L-asparaginase family protein n=1 Tax=Prosthecobacter sp. TaxID=1965333 RepID=UPI0037839773
MKTLRLILATFALHAVSFAADAPITLVIHGGAGVARADLSAEKEAECRKVLEEALQGGHKILREGGTSLDAVQAAIIILEDSPLFNAGRGSALTSAGTVEMDVSIMDGQKHTAGAAACVTGVRNPVRLARLIMERTPHVLLVGQGAETFAKECKLPFEPMEYFITPEQQKRLRKVQKAQASATPITDFTLRTGTVGAVALDKAGHLAAGTSTGGLTNKRPGRAGDSPLIGAGTYAEDGACAVSCTGHGESFIRSVVAYDVAAHMKYAKSDVATAARRVIHEVLPKHEGKGGLIALDSSGNISTPFNTPGMFHAWIKADGTIHVAIFEE